MPWRGVLGSIAPGSVGGGSGVFRVKLSLKPV